MNDSSDFFDYLDWRGDISFDSSPFNAVDALLLCQIAYLDLASATPKCENSAILLKDAARLHQELRLQRAGLMISAKTADLFFRAAKTERFGNVMMSEAVDKYDEKTEEQFSAITFTFQKENELVVFRGTDDTIIGWKEDFNLAFIDEIPAQKDALLYLEEEASLPYIKKVFVAGHSKGGNLALYAAAHLTKYRDKIAGIYNFDGPGFAKEMLLSPQFKAIEKLTHSFYPELSIIGQLFSHFENYTVVKSSSQFLAQHDPFSWGIKARGFDEVGELETGSKYFHKTFNEWFIALGKEKREQFVNALFSPFSNIEYKNLSSLSSDWLHSSAAIIKAINEMDSDLKAQTKEIIFSLFSVARGNIGVLISQK